MKMLGISVAILIIGLIIIGCCLGATCRVETNDLNVRTQVISCFEK